MSRLIDVRKYCKSEKRMAKNTNCGKSIIKTAEVFFTLFTYRFQFMVNGKRVKRVEKNHWNTTFILI